MTDDLFNKEPKDEGTPTPDGDLNAEAYLGLILNSEGKQKYATAEEALKGAVHAQTHITKIEEELEQLRAEKDKGVDMEQILEALKGKSEATPADLPTGVSPEELEAKVTQLLEKRDKVHTQESNIATVVNAFKELYGEKASETMYGKAANLGFSKDEINGLIATNPKAAMSILAVKGKGGAVDITTSGGDINAGDFIQKPDEKPKSIMGATNSSALTDAWRLSQAATLKRLGETA